MTKTRWITVAAGLAVLLIIVQLVPSPPADNPEPVTEVEVPEAVSRVLQQSCYDCHSNETAWPWYAYVAPMKWLIRDHVHEGRGEMNFSEWNALALEDRPEMWEELAEEVEEEHMPLRSYLIVHRDARLSDADRGVLLDWARSQAAMEPRAGEADPTGDDAGDS